MNDIYNLPFDSKRPEYLYGSKTSCREDGMIVSLDSNSNKIFDELESKTGMKIYSLEKGDSWIRNLIKENIILGIGKDDYVEYEFQDFSIYMYKYWTLIDVRKVILPRKIQIKLQSKRRLYLFSAKCKNNGLRLIKTPELIFPSTYIKFINWIKKEKKILKEYKILDCFSYDEKPDFMSGYKILWKNIKSELELSDYIKIKQEYFKKKISR